MIDDLDASSSTLRLLVGQALRSWSIDALLGLLTDNDYIVRTAAARELQVRGESRVYEEVVKLKNDERTYVREICAFILGQLGTPDMPYRNNSWPLLLELLSDQAPEVRAAAAAALGHLCFDSMPFEVERALILRSKDHDKDVRSCVAYALGNSSGSEDAKKVLYQLKEDEDPSVQTYAELGLDLLKDDAAK